jgi:peptide/nickel transport system permease protein
MNLRYLAYRFSMFLFVIWAAATLNFLLPRLVPGDPIATMLQRLETEGQAVSNLDDLISAYRARFGLDAPLGEQYFRYLISTFTFDFGYSITAFPTTVNEIIANSLPWTIMLLATTTIIAFGIGILLGALFVWQQRMSALRAFSWFLIIVAPLPYYLVAIIFLFVFGIALRWFPVTSSPLLGRLDGFNLESIGEVLRYSLLPAISILVASIGGWAISMRAMMISVRGEDYITLARAKGLPEGQIMRGYAMRNAMLPLVTQFGISLARVVSGATLVEVIFLYPGLGSKLLDAIKNLDFTVIQGITFILVVAVATGVMLIDLLYPRLDPRIRYQRQ